MTLKRKKNMCYNINKRTRNIKWIGFHQNSLIDVIARILHAIQCDNNNINICKCHLIITLVYSKQSFAYMIYQNLCHNRIIYISVFEESIFFNSNLFAFFWIVIGTISVWEIDFIFVLEIFLSIRIDHDNNNTNNIHGYGIVVNVHNHVELKWVNEILHQTTMCGQYLLCWDSVIHAARIQNSTVT